MQVVVSVCKHARSSFLAVAIAIVLSLSTRADVVTLVPSADSYARELSPDLNAGGEQNLVVGCLGDRANREVRRGFLKFDLSQIPPGATINSATLNVTVVMVPLGRADSVFELRRVLSQWNEGEVTWNSRLAGVLWQLSGAEGPADTSPNPSSEVQILDLGGYTLPSTPALVADVQAWVNSPANNFGWIFQSEDEVTPKTARRFGSREDLTFPPVLTIDYTVATLSATVQPSEQTVIEGSTVTFNSLVNGTPPFTYQWLFNGNPLPSATADTLVLANVQTNQSGLYSISVSNISGSVTSAPATLTVTNQPVGVPFVRITSPTNGARFPTQAVILLSADASETNGNITQVEFFLGTNSVGVGTSPPYSVTVSNLAAGTYLVGATATDDRGTNGTSPKVSFSVVGSPAIFFTSPAEHARFPLGTNVPIVVNVISNGAKISEVDFYEAHFDSGQDSFVTNLIGTVLAPPYSLNWLPSAAADYSLSAIVQNEFGQTASSTNLDIRVFIPELILPVIKVTHAPPNFSRVTAVPVEIGGTANDNIGLDRVEYQIVSGPLLQNIGPFVPANGTAEWTAAVQLVPGKNAVRLRSIDLAGNRSRVVTLDYTYVATAPLTIQINGSGAITPNLDGRNLELEKRYAVTARPATGFIFANWQNATPSNMPTATFEMKSDLIIVANFVSNPFPPLAGQYMGLFFDPNPDRLRPEDAGQFSFTLNKQGVFSGRLGMGGAMYSFNGRFDPNGHAQFSISRPAQSPLVVLLDLDPVGAGVSGSVIVSSDNLPLLSPLSGKRNIFNARTNPAPQAGQRSFELQRTTGAGAETVATMNAQISRAGFVSLGGSLADLRPFGRATSLGNDGTAPLYLSFNHGTEIFIGWLEFGDGSSQSVTGQILHALPAQPAVEVLNVSSQ